MTPFAIRDAAPGGDVEACRALFVEYQRALGVSLCFQGFDRELAALPGDYAPPRGALLLATAGAEPAGCVALRPVAPGEAEMKRLYVRPAHRGGGLGRALAVAAIGRARSLGYATLRLDTLERLAAAIALYGTLGFVETTAYHDARPEEGLRYFALDLRATSAVP